MTHEEVPTSKHCLCENKINVSFALYVEFLLLVFFTGKFFLCVRRPMQLNDQLCLAMVGVI